MKRICPICKKEYTTPPAISRKDNATPICSECGTREALQSLGLGIDEIIRIMATIKQNAPRGEFDSTKQ